MRQLSAIMFTDIAGYTAMMQRDEQAAMRVRSLHRSIFEAEHAAFEGNIVQYYGDGTLSIFKSVIHAVECALKMQEQFISSNPEIPVKIAIHLGDIYYDETEVYGNGVNVTARIESISKPGSIFISKKVQDELRSHPHIKTSLLGHFEFKNVSGDMAVYNVEADFLKNIDSDEISENRSRPIKSIAVLPFVNMSTDPDTEYFCDGITEEIINALTRVQDLKVSSRTSSFFFKNAKLKLTDIGQKLNVTTILEGSVRLHKDNIRITAQLIDVRDDFHFWSENFDRKLDNIFEIQDEVSIKIAEKLREHLGPMRIESSLVSDPNVPLSSYKKYLKSRYYILTMRETDIDLAIHILNELIEEEPEYTYAYLGLHMAYTLKGTLGLMPSYEAFQKAVPYLQSAIALDENMAECQLQLAWMSFLQDFDLDATYAHLSKVKENKPIVDYYQTMASVIITESRFKAAHRYIDIALQLDPFSDISHHLKGFIFYCQKKYEKALEWFDKAIQLKSSDLSYMEYAECLVQLNQADRIHSLLLDKDGSMDPLLKIGIHKMAMASQSKQSKNSIETTDLEKSLGTEKVDRALHFLILIHAISGDAEKVLAYIKEASKLRLPMLVYLQCDPILEPYLEHEGINEVLTSVLKSTQKKHYESRKYKNPALHSDKLNALRPVLKELMKEKKLYLDPELSLNSLAETMEINANEMSQLLNEGFDRNFSEFVNAYRAEAFKEAVQDDKNKHLTLLAIAYSCGFNSKTVFNTYFKKHTGMTPGQYLKQTSTN